MAFDPDLASAIGSIPAQYGVDPDYIRKMAVAESGGNTGAQAATSSAAGPYQIIGSTADSLGISRADRYDPDVSTDAISRFTKANASGLQSAGFDPTHGNLYLSHFAGLGGAKSVLGADPATPVSQLLPSSSIAANPFLRGMSAGDLTDWASRKMSGGPAMQMPATTGGPARPAGFGLTGPQQVDPLTGQAVGGSQPATSPYGQIGDALQGAQASQQQAKGQQRQSAPAMPAIEGGSSPISLQQARQSFDANRFFTMLKNAGVTRR